MKKITFLAILFAFSANAQTYCSISSDYEGVEEITSVTLSNATITNTNTTSIAVDFISTIANVNANQAYNLVVKGNSYGAFDNEYTAYIDWNHNGILNDAGEMYYIGLINNSTGYDAKNASISITVPNNAVAGNTRIRIVKVYTDASDDYILNPDPCYVSLEDVFFGDVDDFYGSYGQALDFTLNVTALGVDNFDKNALSVYPNPVKEILNINYKSEITEAKIFNLLGQEVFSQSVNSSDFQINLEKLSSGNYILKLSSPEGQQNLKLIKK